MKKFIKAVTAYIKGRAESDKDFAAKVKAKNDDYEGCCHYIISEVRKMNVSVLDDAEVFGMAVHFFDEPDIKAPGKIQSAKVVHSIKLTDDEREKLREEAAEAARREYIAQQKQRELDELQKKQEREIERKRRAEEKERAEAEARRKAAEESLKNDGDLFFDFYNNEGEE